MMSSLFSFGMKELELLHCLLRDTLILSASRPERSTVNIQADECKLVVREGNSYFPNYENLNVLHMKLCDCTLREAECSLMNNVVFYTIFE